MKKLNKGDLVYIPSGAMLHANDSHGTVQRIMKLAKPANLLITELSNLHFEVLYEGEKWLIEKNKTYKVTA
mgnify:CR=1 FL=1|tara:strand:+ start:120 stop:332 length:213 start_codon:yes stop_codon:yes gene_type:complete